MSDSATLWTVAWWACLSMGFSRQEYWSGLPFTPPGNLPHLGINWCLLSLLHWQATSFPLVPPGKLIKPTHLKQLWWVQDLPTKALIPCCKESHSFQRIVHSPDGTQIEGPGTNWLQEGSTGDGELEISDVLKWDRFYSYCFPLEPVQCKLLMSASEFLYFHDAYPPFIYLQHPCGWMSTLMPKLLKPVSLFF